jgi:hypothetical protein
LRHLRTVSMLIARSAAITALERPAAAANTKGEWPRRSRAVPVAPW